MTDCEIYLKSNSIVYLRKISHQRNYALVYLYLSEQDKKGKMVFKITEIANDLRMDRAYIYQVLINMRNLGIVEIINNEKVLKIRLDRESFDNIKFKIAAETCLNVSK